MERPRFELESKSRYAFGVEEVCFLEQPEITQRQIWAIVYCYVDAKLEQADGQRSQATEYDQLFVDGGRVAKRRNDYRGAIISYN